MAKKRIINTKIWEDAWFNDLDPIEKLFFIYLLTNPMTNILGAYEISRGTIGRATGLESRVVEEILSRFEKAEKVFYKNGWIVISNFIKHQNWKSPKILAGLNAEIENTPKNIRNLIKSPIKLYGMDTVSHSNSNSNSNLNTKEEEVSSVIKKFDQVDLELATLLRDEIFKNNPTFKEPNLPVWASHVRLMRTQDERTYEQIKFLIQWSQRNDFWQANILSIKKLREKFDTLVAQAKRDVLKGQKKRESVIL